MHRSLPARLCLPLCLAALGCAAGSAALAQVKTDGQWRGSGGAALSLTSGNSQSSALNLKAETTRATLVDKINLSGSYDYARSRSEGLLSTTANKWNAFGQYDYNIGARSYAFGKLGLESDELLQLDLRTSLAAGAGYKLIDNPETSFNLFGGLGYSRDVYGAAQTIHDSTGTRFWRASVLLGEESSHRLTASTSLKQRLEVSPGYSGDQAVLARFTVDMNVAINRTLGLTVGLVSDYNSRPSLGRESTDTRLFTGLSFRFGAN